MWVKCPKCRFRFDQPGGDNGEEIQCVCPRCGTPFTFTDKVSDDLLKDAEGQKDGSGHHEETLALYQAHSHSAAEHLEHGAEEYTSEETDYQQTSSFASNVSSSSSASASSHASHSSDAASSIASASGTSTPNWNAAPVYQSPQKPLEHSETLSPNANRAQKHSKWRYILALITVIVLAFFLTHECSGNDDSTANLGIEEVSDANVPAEEDIATPAFDASAPEEKAPAWIQGTWKVNTKYGGIMISIRDNRITETSAGETSHGTFRCQHRRLYCDFGNGETFVYRLDMKAHQIDAGQGLLMKKLDQ